MRCCLKIHTSSCTLYYRLLELLEGQPLHPNALSSTLGMERRLFAYHLAKLEDRGFVTSRYVISELDKSKGKALKVYTVTDKAADVRAKLKEEL
jgi:predicted transcriptional regulator